MNTGSSTQGMRRSPATSKRRGGRGAPLLVERAEIDQQGVGARHERADLVGGKRHRGNRARREQRVRREGLRDRIGDAMHAGAARAQAHQDIGCEFGKLFPHLSSLRRHDPDQVRWVGVRLSARRRPGTP